MNTEFFYLVREPEIVNENTPLLVLIHGYGSNEEDLFSFADQFDSRFLIISLRAPLTLPFGGYAWYSIDFENIDGKVSNGEEAVKAREGIASFVKKIQEKYNILPSKTVLLGFSQGAILSYGVSLSYPEIVQKIIALSGYAFNPILPKNIKDLDYQNLDIFASHGTADQVIPVKLAQQTNLFLKELKVNHIYKEYPVGHSVCPQNFFDAKNWLENRV